MCNCVCECPQRSNNPTGYGHLSRDLLAPFFQHHTGTEQGSDLVFCQTILRKNLPCMLPELRWQVTQCTWGSGKLYRSSRHPIPILFDIHAAMLSVRMRHYLRRIVNRAGR